MKEGYGVTRTSDGQLCEYRGRLLDGRMVFIVLEDGPASVVLARDEWEELLHPAIVSISCDRYDLANPMRYVMVPCDIWGPDPPITQKNDIRLVMGDPTDVYFQGTAMNRFYGHLIPRP
jgi:hypothetical protein